MQWYVLAILAAVLTALATILKKEVLIKEHSLEFSTILAVLNFILMFPFLAKMNFAIGWNAFIVIAIAMLFGIFAFWLSIKAMKRLDVSLCAPLMMAGPLFTWAFALLMLGEGVTFKALIGMLLLIIGAYILLLKQGQRLTYPIKQLIKSKALHYVIISLILYGIIAVVDRIILSSTGNFRIDVYTYTFVSNWLLAMGFVALLLWRRKEKKDGSIIKEMKTTLKASGVIILLVAILTVGYRLLQSAATVNANAALVSAIKSANVLLVVIAGGSLFQERERWVRIGATLIMVIGTLLIIA